MLFWWVLLKNRELFNLREGKEYKINLSVCVCVILKSQCNK